MRYQKQLKCIISLTGLSIPIKSHWFQPDNLMEAVLSFHHQFLFLDKQERRYLLIFLAVCRHVTESWTVLTGHGSVKSFKPGT